MGLNEALGAPIETLNVSSEFNKQRKGYKHHGVDLSTPSGTNVVAIDGGTVIDAEIRNDNCGGTLYIEHAGGFKSRFCHLKQINVKKGDKIFYIDKDGNHLFYYYPNKKNGYVYINFYKIIRN